MVTKNHQRIVYGYEESKVIVYGYEESSKVIV